MKEELLYIKKKQIDMMSKLELAYWHINSFTPARYYNDDDVMYYAYHRMLSLVPISLATEFHTKLWEMHLN